MSKNSSNPTPRRKKGDAQKERLEKVLFFDFTVIDQLLDNVENIIRQNQVPLNDQGVKSLNNCIRKFLLDKRINIEDHTIPVLDIIYSFILYSFPQLDTDKNYAVYKIKYKNQVYNANRHQDLYNNQPIARRTMARVQIDSNSSAINSNLQNSRLNSVPNLNQQANSRNDNQHPVHQQTLNSNLTVNSSAISSNLPNSSSNLIDSAFETNNYNSLNLDTDSITNEVSHHTPPGQTRISEETETGINNLTANEINNQRESGQVIIRQEAEVDPIRTNEIQITSESSNINEINNQREPEQTEPSQEEELDLLNEMNLQRAPRTYRKKRTSNEQPSVEQQTGKRIRKRKEYQEYLT